MTTLNPEVIPHIEACIRTIQTTAIKADWDDLRAFLATNPDHSTLYDKTAALMTESGFSSDHITLFADAITEGIQNLLEGRTNPTVFHNESAAVDALTEAQILLDLVGRFPERGVGEGTEADGAVRITVAGRTFRGATRLDALCAALDGLSDA